MRHLVATLLFVLVAAVAVVGQDRLPIGSRVGNDMPAQIPAPGGYDPAGRRDPFVSLVAPKRGVPTPTVSRPKAGLSGVVLADVAVKGVVQNGRTVFAVLEGPGGRSFVARSRDRLQDATVKTIDADGVTFVQQVVDVMGAPHARDVRKSLRQTTTEEDR
jgi:Tfp pilus assembly protein PilP